MKLVFNVQLSLQELSAFIRDFNKDNDHDDKVHCASFLVHFFRMGFQEKTKRLHAVWAEKKRIKEEKERKAREEAEELEKRNAAKVSYLVIQPSTLLRTMCTSAVCSCVYGLSRPLSLLYVYS